jgi:hypothetical protein
MTLFRVEKGEHKLSLDKLQTILDRLHLRLRDVFPDEF